MKKILIVNNNMKVGGVQKALYNLLWEIEGKYDITLCLFKKTGAYVNSLPPSVKVVEVAGPYAYLGVSQNECSGINSLIRGAYAFSARLIGREKTLSLMKRHQPELDSRYDCAISFLHNGREKSFYGGVQDFVLNCVSADKKVAFLHCDYRNCGSNNPENNRNINRFDAIAACSDGCRSAFLSVLPELGEKCITVRNAHRFDEIRSLSEDDSVVYDNTYVNLLIVARLSHEKGVDRAIEAVSESVKAGAKIKLHIVGNGAVRKDLDDLVAGLELSENVCFYGEQKNPYRFMKNADVLVISSYHEAAPMVIDEAVSLGLPILTVKTTSSHGMVETAGCGWVCENSQQALNSALLELVSDKKKMFDLKQFLSNRTADNELALKQFDDLIK